MSSGGVRAKFRAVRLNRWGGIHGAVANDRVAWVLRVVTNDPVPGTHQAVANDRADGWTREAVTWVWQENRLDAY